MICARQGLKPDGRKRPSLPGQENQGDRNAYRNYLSQERRHAVILPFREKRTISMLKFLCIPATLTDISVSDDVPELRMQVRQTARRSQTENLRFDNDPILSQRYAMNETG